MDPIRTAVKYALIPLRTAVQLGELFVEGGEQAPPAYPAEPPVAPKPRAPRKPKQTNEVATPIGEPAPVDLAREGKGRQPAPLGSNGSSS